MKVVSDAYKSGMKALLREQSFVKIFFENVDVSAARDGYWGSNGQLTYSESTTLNYLFRYKQGVATLELNRWALDGNFRILPDGIANDGFVSNIMSDGNGEFSTDAFIARLFNDLHTFAGITLTFDSREECYPREATIEFYRNLEKIDEIIVSPTEPRVAVERVIEDVDGIRIVFGSTLPYHRPRMEMVMFGVERVFTNDDIVSCKQSHDVDPLSRRLPDEKFSFTLIDYEHSYDPDNPDALYRYIDINSPISIQHGYTLADGTVEWLKADRYLLSAKPTVKDDQATFDATGLIGSLTDRYYKSQHGLKSLYDMAIAVLEDADLTPASDGGDPWDVDESLQDMFTTAVLPIDTHMNCLQLIAHAARCRLYTDDDNIIHIKPFGVTLAGLYNGEFTDNGHLWISEWESVNRGGAENDNYVTLELNRWVLDGKTRSCLAYDESDLTEHGYVTYSLSNSAGSFAVPPCFTRTFDVSHDLRVVALRFDTYLNEHPRSVTINYYRDNELVTTSIQTDVRSSEVFIFNNEAVNCDKIEVTLNNTLPQSRVRVTKVYYRETDFTLNFNSISENTQVLSKIDQLKEITVARAVYTPEAESIDLYEETTTKTQLHVEFGCLASDIEITVDGGSLGSSVIYGRAADLVLSSGTKTVKITGKRISESAVVVSYPVAASGETDVEENPLITSDEMSDALAEHVGKYLQMRNTYDANYRGNPELEAGDIIGLQTRYTDEMDALVLIDEITFNGSLSGKIKAKGLI